MITITPQSPINISVASSNQVGIIVTPAAPIQLALEGVPDVTIETLEVIENVTDLTKLFALAAPTTTSIPTGLGDWFGTELQPTTTSGIAFTANGLECQLLDDVTRLFIDNSSSSAGGIHNPSASENITKSDYLFSWTGKVDVFDTTHSMVVVGAYRTHGGATESESIERLVGFFADRTTETWRAAIWRPSVPNTSAYAEFWGEDTGLSIYTSCTLQVVICNKGTRAAFYKNGDLISVQNDNLPVASDNSTSGDRLFIGHHLRYYDVGSGSMVFPKTTTTDMTLKQYRLDSVLTVEYGETDITGIAAGGDLSGTYPNPQLAAGVVGTTELANAAVTSIKLATGSVTSAKIPDGAVTTTKIGSEAWGFPTMLITDEADEFSIWAKMPNFSVNYALTVPEVTIDLTGIEVGGDLQGTLPNPTVHRLQGNDIHNTPDDLDLFQFKTSNNKIHWVSYAEAGLITSSDLVHNFDPTNPTSPVWFWDDFLSMSTEAGEIGSHNWNITSATATNAQSEQNHPGNAIIRCSSTANTVGTLTLGVGSSSNAQYRFDEFTEMTIVFKCLETDTDCFRALGMMDTWNSVTPANGVFIRKDTAGTTWNAVCRASSVETASSALWTQDTNWHKIKIVKNGTTMEFYVDGATTPTTTISTNVPAATVIMNPVYMNRPSGTSTVRRNQLDFWSFKLIGPTR